MEVAELAEGIAASQDSLDALPADLDLRIRSFDATVLALLEAASVDVAGTTAEGAEKALAHVEEDYHALKDVLLGAGAVGRVPVTNLVAWLDRLSHTRRMAQQMERGSLHLRELGSLASGVEEHASHHEAVDPSRDGELGDWT
jgi:phosphate:Na+ symporter